MRDRHDLIAVLKGYAKVLDIRKFIESIHEDELKEGVIEYLLSRELSK